VTNPGIFHLVKQQEECCHDQSHPYKLTQVAEDPELIRGIFSKSLDGLVRVGFSRVQRSSDEQQNAAPMAHVAPTLFSLEFGISR
jgi:hypothetical protein